MRSQSGGVRFRRLWNLEATPCPAGTINTATGATSAQQYNPWPDGFYSSIIGSSICYMCPLNFICRTGSKVPSTPGTTDQGDSIQPSLYTSQGCTLITLRFGIIVVTFTAIVLLTCTAGKNSSHNFRKSTCTKGDIITIFQGSWYCGKIPSEGYFP